MPNRSVEIAYEYGEVGFGSSKHEDYAIDVQFMIKGDRVNRVTYKKDRWASAMNDIANFIKEEVGEYTPPPVVDDDD